MKLYWSLKVKYKYKDTINRGKGLKPLPHKKLIHLEN
ncbi:hypothetical protein Hore_17850 [Halothermothrix orenii H 168]|uniref:Uncharacterized protein n=1 Tax=Halothermothrix orenii (strain H 168 / OCM 544 / DSM 9562) TaxID=373903 RepID=B8CZ15_HALOH|nr:hypothetical protein Hore_17850 [Halothermothrix orenii H 168]